jgi:hypothetical protein
MLLMLLTGPLASASDITGDWSGSAELKSPDGQAMVLDVHATFKQANGAVTGTIGKEEDDQYPIDNGKIEDNKITFEFTAPEGTEPRLYTVRLTVVNETQLQGEFEFKAGDDKVTGKLTLTRAK